MNQFPGGTFVMLRAAALIAVAGLFAPPSDAGPLQNAPQPPAQPQQAPPAAEAEPPAPPPLPRHLQKTIQDAEAQVATLAAAARMESGPARLVLEAEHEYLLLATEWLKPALKDPVSGALQAHYGRKLLDHRQAFSEYLRAARLRMLSPPEQAGAPEERVSAVAGSLQAFIGRARARGPAGDGAIDPLLLGLFTDLSPGLLEVESHTPRSTWLMAVSQRAVALEETGFDPARVDQLITQIHSARLSTEIRAELLALAQEARAAAARPNEKPRASAAAYALRRAVAIAENLPEAGFSQPLIALYRSHLRTAAQLIPDPRTRGPGLDRMDLMERGLSLQTLIRSLSRGGPRGADKTSASLSALLESAFTASITGADSASGAAALATLSEMARSMRSSRDLLALKPPVDLEDAWRNLQADYLKQEVAAAILAAALAANLKASAGAEARRTLDELALAGDRLTRVRRVPDWIAALDRLQARPTGGAARELKALARAMGKKTTKSAEADGALARFHRQFESVMNLPGEEKLASKDGPEPEFGPLILQQIGRWRLQWAGAWASGDFEKAAEPARRLQQASELLAARRLLMAPAELDQASARLNRWAAWHVSPQEMRILLGDWNESVRGSMRMLSIGHSAGLDRLADEINSRADLPLLVDYLNRLLADAWAPSEKFGAVADQFIPPAAEAFALSHRQTLARLGLHASEAAQALKQGRLLVLDEHRAEMSKQAAALVKTFSAP